MASMDSQQDQFTAQGASSLRCGEVKSAIGRYGVWTRYFRDADPSGYASAAAELEDLGFGAIWVPGIAGGEDHIRTLESLLAATSTITIASGILNIWAHDPREVGRQVSTIQDRHPGRFLLGLGVSHAQLMPDKYQKPLSAMQRYLDALDEFEATGAGNRFLAALGPKMVQLAGERSLGVHPYNVNTKHTLQTRQALGSVPLVAPEHAAVIASDPHVARVVAREHLSDYLGHLVNYDRNLLRLGFARDDLEAGGSDRLIDALVAWGDASTVAQKLSAHLEAGADHVCVQLRLTPRGDHMDGWRQLASVLFA